MNLICNELRSTIAAQRLSALTFVSLVGPPLHVWNLEQHVQSWLASGRRNAAVTNCPRWREAEAIVDPAKRFAWKLL